ncbi:hypothetical protein EMIHUDRAFT_446462 [Emiliania huxleyi CCMP1516]|uniref:PDZ domain-containing protein n=2 Tax=Emiliania huxleyi TaxID=2903 RepID=A0A0D3I5Z8_EMIH1|nr:hypothetical protein EMIHUDRAFT_446462 [Emiliania huxleyi CCMP1516]EOD06683.1 hypothetical protein EMIHUDRAFT_446462 [Emiliania huxleyi CCMP1516]|eukprot:XP_005759112.1 hypothetical protein EMIHUDRAFT_446462 [Emiliania huxleyi CCMP1516]
MWNVLRFLLLCWLSAATAVKRPAPRTPQQRSGPRFRIVIPRKEPPKKRLLPSLPALPTSAELQETALARATRLREAVKEAPSQLRQAALDAPASARRAVDEAPGRIQQAVLGAPDALRDRALRTADAFDGGVFALGFAAALVVVSGGTTLLAREAGAFLTEGGRGEVLERALLFGAILGDVQDGYVDRQAIDLDELFETGVNAMLGSLDPYTTYEDAAQAEDLTTRTTGRYGGIGITIGADEGSSARGGGGGGGGGAGAGPAQKGSPSILVLSALEGYAYDAGVRPGDRILQIDGRPISGARVEEVKNMLRGEPGTQVSLLLQRDGSTQEAIPIDVQRAEVRLPDVSLATMMAPRTGYVKLDGFSEGTAEELARAMVRLYASQRAAGEPLESLVLDLRDNPGGLLDAAVGVSQLLVPQEVVEPLPGGRSLKLTVAKYFTPSGRCIQAISYAKPPKPGAELKVAEPKADEAGSPTDRAPDAAPADGDDEGAARRRRRQESYTERSLQPNPVYLTSNGREVQTGGGIAPDVAAAGKPVGALERSLIRQGAFFRFASQWLREHEGTPTQQAQLLESTRGSDEAYRDFVRFARERYMAKRPASDASLASKPAAEAPSAASGAQKESPPSEAGDADGWVVQDKQLVEPLRALEKALSRDGDGQRTRSSSELKALRRALASEELSQFESQHSQIAADVREAVLARLLPPSERLRAFLRDDPQVLAALAVANDEARYEALLAPPAAYAPAFPGDDATARTTADASAKAKANLRSASRRSSLGSTARSDDPPGSTPPPTTPRRVASGGVARGRVWAA